MGIEHMEPRRSQQDTYLTRMRGNAVNAQMDGANEVDLILSLFLVTRGHSRPTEDDIADAVVLGEQFLALNDIRRGPGGVGL